MRDWPKLIISTELLAVDSHERFYSDCTIYESCLTSLFLCYHCPSVGGPHAFTSHLDWSCVDSTPVELTKFYDTREIK